MGTMIVRMRVLAVAPSRVWIAVGGILGPATQRHIRQLLHDRAAAGTREFFLDLRELHSIDAVAKGEVRILFAGCPDAHFHLVGAPAEIRDCVGTDPRFTLHSRLESAWNRWSQDH